MATMPGRSRKPLPTVAEMLTEIEAKDVEIAWLREDNEDLIGQCNRATKSLDDLAAQIKRWEGKEVRRACDCEAIESRLREALDDLYDATSDMVPQPTFATLEAARVKVRAARDQPPIKNGAPPESLADAKTASKVKTKADFTAGALAMLVACKTECRAPCVVTSVEAVCRDGLYVAEARLASVSIETLYQAHITSGEKS